MPEWKLADAEEIRKNLTKSQEDEISMLYRNVYLRTRKQMLAIPKDGTTSQQIEKQYLNKLIKDLDASYKSLGVGLEKEIKKQAKKAANGVVEDAKKLTTKAGFKIEGAYSHVPRDVVNALVTGQVYGGNWSLSGAIWRDIDKHKSDISKIVAEGVAANLSSYDIAKSLEQYVDPKARKPWDWSKVYPGTSKKVDYNAQRLARTMVSHAYQQSLERVCKKNPFVDGYIWQSAHTDRTCQLCADRDGQFFAKGDLPLDHPNGMCTFLANITESMTDIADRLADWAKGGDDPEINSWLEGMTGKTFGAPTFNDAQNKWLAPLGYSASNMPKDFKEFAMKLSPSQQSELLKLAGATWGHPHPYQEMEKWYNANLATVRPGVEQITKTQPAGYTAEAIRQLFTSQQGRVGDLNAEAARWWAGLSKEERDAVVKYTSNYYTTMNGYLRGFRPGDDEAKKTIKNCASALSKASSPFDIVVGRGSDMRSLGGMLGNPAGLAEAARAGQGAEYLQNNRGSLIGSVASDAGFLSTTPVSGGGFSGDITYRIIVPKGSEGAYVDDYSRFKGEREFLLQKGGTFRVVDIDTADGNRATVYMEYLGSKEK